MNYYGIEGIEGQTPNRMQESKTNGAHLKI